MTNIIWEKIVEREGDFLKNQLLYESYAENFQLVYGRNHSDFLTIRKRRVFTHFLHKKNGKEFSQFLKEKITKNPQFMNEMSEKGKLHFRNLIAFSEKVNKKELNKMQNKELKNLIIKYFKLYKSPYPYFNITLFAEELEEKKEIIRTMADLRLLGRSSFNKTHKLIKPLFEEVGRKFGLSAEEVNCLKPKEILSLLNGNRLDIKKIMRDRQHCYFMFHEGNFVLKENEVYVIEEELAREPSKEPTNILKGRGTFQSLYKGKVKIIKTRKDIEKMDYGDVMVSRMITPDLMIECIKKAGAIITDEGGLTCHAAVLSRELNIPALIGTGNATKLLKDGDLIEFDTYKGQAKKVKFD